MSYAHNAALADVALSKLVNRTAFYSLLKVPSGSMIGRHHLNPETDNEVQT